MGKTWDGTGIAFDPATWVACLRVLKPGGHLLAFGGTRTSHRMVCAIEDAGFEIRDSVVWMYGSGFPKSLDVAKAIDKAARGVPQGGADPTSAHHGQYKTQATEGKRSEGDKGQGFGAGPGQFMAQVGRKIPGGAYPNQDVPDVYLVNEAEPWQGWGTALKPAHEPIVVARKPLSLKTVAANVLAHGTGALNIDGCRVSAEGEIIHLPQSDPSKRTGVVGTPVDRFQEAQRASIERANTMGRWPANVILDEEAGALLDAQVSPSTSRKGRPRGSAESGEGWGMTKTGAEYVDAGGPSRFFYCPKTSASERSAGLPNKNIHPTVKPIALMQYLIRLITPPGGTILDPFLGSGTTAIAAHNEGFEFIGIEKEVEYFVIAKQRIAHAVTATMKAVA